MCRARPGPRCSNSGRIRHNRAKNNLNKAQQKAEQFAQKMQDKQQKIDNNQAPPLSEKAQEKLQQQEKVVQANLHEAHLRMEQANRVWYATPKGQEELAGTIVQLEEKFSSTPQPRKGDTEAEHEYAHMRTELNLLRNNLNGGIERRMNSNADLNDFIAERPVLRQEAINRGATLNPQAQKSSHGEDYQSGAPQKVHLEPYTPEQLTRAKSWVETGADSGWNKGGSFRPPQEIEGTQIGEKADEPLSRMMRLSTPDGSVVETRHDLHITKNDDGKFVVSRRATTAASFEDASPIDKNTQPLGHLLKNTKGIDRVEVLGEYNSLHAARVRRGMIANNTTNLPDGERVDFVAHAAQDGRDLTIHRFGNPKNKDTMNRGFVVGRHRYESTLDADDVRNSFYQQDIKKQRKFDQAMEKARANKAPAA